MSYLGVNQLDYSIVSGANSISTTGAGGPNASIPVTAGNLLIGVGYSQKIATASLSGSLGNTFSPYNANYAALNGNIGIALYWGIATFTGTESYTLAATGACNGIYVAQFQVSQNGILVASAGTYVASIGSGSNNASSGNIAGGSLSNLWFGFCFDPACTASPSQGAGFTGTTAVWETQQGGTVAPAKPQNALLSGTNPVTFSTNNPGDAVYTLGAVFTLQPPNIESWPLQGALLPIMAQ